MNGLYLFNKANIYISVLEEPLINGETPRRLFLHNKKLTKYATMKNKETMNVDGNEIKIIETPGHTIGSACYLINNRYLISGDLLYLTRNKKIKPFLFLNNMDHKKLKESLDTMKNIIENVDYLLTSHSGMYKK
jgi:glyoxylase-like metal-dependent hydrolase (beta-lactamase superfamily II)